MAERKKMTDEQLRQLVDDEFESAMGAGDLSSERAKAWDYYLSKRRGDEVEGYSEVVTSDVADVVDGMMPSLLRIFTTADNLVNFDPVGAEDVKAAEQESDYCNHVFFKKNPAFMILYTWFFDALVQKNGVVKAWWDESEEVTTETYKSLTEDELLDLMGDDELEAVERSERTEDLQVGGQILPQTVHDIEFRRVSKSGRPKVANVPSEEYRISADANTLDPGSARMVGHEREETRSTLIEMGFDKEIVNKLPVSGDATSTQEGASRKDKSDEQQETSVTPDKSQEKILVREAYIKVDFDGDGRSELRQVFTAGEKLLSNDQIDRQPFHVISPQPLPHKHFGRASAEKAMDIQDVTTTLTRQILTNLYHTNNPGHAVWEQAMSENTMDDLLTTRVGRIARFSRPVGESYSTISVPFTAGASFPMLEHFDKVKRDRTGVGPDSEGLSPEALKNIQQSVLASSTDISKMKIEAVARIFAETGIKSLFLHIHELLQKHQNKEDIFLLRGEWVPVRPTEWRDRVDMTVNIGLGIGTREQNLIHLEAIWDKQAAMVGAGGMNLTVTPKNIYNTAAEVVKNANLKQPGLFFTDPGDKQAPPPSQEQEKLIAQQQQIDARQQQLDAQKQQNDRDRIELDHQRDLLEIQRKQKADEDKFALGMEQVLNKLTELELNSGRDVPGSRV